MPRLLQIDSCLGIGSTGRITESIGELAISRGWDCYIIHGARYVKHGTCMHSVQVGNKLNEYVHFAESLLFDGHGLGSRLATRRVIEIIKEINPDIIQLHCIHGYYINYKILFDYLNSTNIPVVWTFHDCWAFTGHCSHFVSANCMKWNTGGCCECPLLDDYPKSISDRSKRNFELKKRVFVPNANLHIVAVSKWLANFTKESFLGEKDIRIINNGIDINCFRPYPKKNDGCFRIIGVATSWTKDKGLYDFYELREHLDEKVLITLVGLTQKQILQLPEGISGIARTDSVQDLAKLYSEADVFVNPTYADSFPTVNMEALACGTPVITYKTGGSPEIIDQHTGIVVEQGDVNGLINGIEHLRQSKIAASVCRNRAVEHYNRDDRFMDYITLYEELLKGKN